MGWRAEDGGTLGVPGADEQVASLCPLCRSPWVEERYVERRTIDGDERREAWSVHCARDHGFRLLRWQGESAVVARPETIRGTPFVEAATSDRCVKCGGEIQPGQAYSRLRGVRHLGCS